MEDFPEGSKKFLKKPSDFQEVPDLGAPANDQAKEKLLDVDKPMFADLLSQIERGAITKEKAFARLTGISESFFEIHKSASLMQDRLSVQTIQNFMRDYGEWTREELLQFVNSEKNQVELKKRPALTIALYELLDRSRI